jgi:hypothetical protein
LPAFYGARAVPDAANVEPLAVVSFVQRVHRAGRNGKLFYRGCLLEGDVQSPSGFPISENAPAGAAFGTGLALIVSLFYDYANPPTNGLHLATWSPSGVWRYITSFVYGRYTVAKLGKKWYNRK